MTTVIRDDVFRRVEASTKGVTIVDTPTGQILSASLDAHELRALAAALTTDQGGQWTRDDLPSEDHLLAVYRHGDPAKASAYERGGIIAVLDALVDHLKTSPGPSERECRDAVDDLRTMRRERDAAVERADQLRDERDDALSAGLEALGAAESKVRVLEGERAAQPALAVSRADVAEALARCLNPEMWNVTFPSVVDEMCALFGIEAEQAVDPVQEKARELWEAGAANHLPLGEQPANVRKAFNRLARHVLGQEADHA